MKRKVVSLLIISLPVLLAAVMLRLPVAGQSTPAETDGNALPQPQQIVIRQQIPLSFTITAPAAVTDSVPATQTGNLLGALINSINRSANQTGNLTTTASAQTVVVTLTLDLQLTVSDTLTTTVPSTVTLTLADESVTAPVSVTVGPAPQAAVAITLLAPVTTAALTSTEAITPVAEVTATTAVTTPPVSPTAAITGTIAITANLRSGPDTTFDAVATASAGQSVIVVAQNADATWYLLNNGLWIASSLVGNVQGQPPLATEELVTALRAQAVITPTTPVTTTAPVTSTTPTTPTTTTVTNTTATTTTATTTTTDTAPSLILVPTPTAAAQTTQPAQPPRVTVDANLRAGPGITFTLLGGTITGQEINIVARNEDGSWFLLDNGGWVSAALVANPPVDVPLYTGTPPTAGAPDATATPLPTPTPVLTNTTPVLGVRENLYAIRVDGIVDGYDFTLRKIDDLINQADGDVALLKDRAWIVEMTTAITLLRSTSDEVRALTAPPLFSAAHTILLDAANAFTGAADLLAEGVDQLDTDRLDQAFAQITTGNNLLTRAQAAVEQATP